MKTLRPIKHKDAYTVAIEEKIRDYFAETIFDPLREILASFRVPDRENAISGGLRLALQTGRVWYADGSFFGSFNASISSELRSLGATWSERDRSFKLTNLPLDLRDAVASSVERARDVHAEVERFLAAAEENAVVAATGIQIDVALSRIRGDLWRQLEQTVPETALEFVEVSAEVTPGVEKILVEEFLADVDKSIKSFLPTELAELRAQVQANAFAGYRTDRLAELIESRYGVAKRKAAFLADQETGLFVSKFREARYRELGIRTYKWSTSHDDRVRADHRVLDGTIHSWENPPITNRATGARNHPGEDYRCRCVPIPVVDLVERANSKREFRCRVPRPALVETSA